jgi:hypothetical protein
MLLHADFCRDAAYGIFEIDIQAIMNVFAPRGRVGLRVLPAEEAREEIPQVAEAARSDIHTAKVETTVPGPRLGAARRPREPIMAELVVLAPLLRVTQHFVGFRDLLELPLRSPVTRIDVGVVLSRQLSVRALDIGLRRAAAKS